MSKNKKLLLGLIISLTVIAIFILCWILFLNMWTVKPLNDINSVTLRILGDSGYSDVIIADEKKIAEIRESVCGLQKKTNITAIVSVRSAEKFQKDPQFAMTFEYNGNSQEVMVHKNSVVIFNDTHTYFLQLEDMETDNLINILNSYSA